MSVRAVTPLVEPHGLVVVKADSDAEGDYAQIPLRDRRGEVVAWTVVDPDDAEAISRHRWSLMKLGYVHRRARKQEDPSRRIVMLHRELLGLKPGDGLQADHINGDRLDNRRANLRVVTNAQNAQNMLPRAGSSRHRGVSFYKRDACWVASVTHNGRKYHIGRFATEDGAAVAAAAKRAELFTHANEERHRVA